MIKHQTVWDKGAEEEEENHNHFWITEVDILSTYKHSNDKTL